MAVKELALGFALSYMVMVVSATMRRAGGIIGMAGRVFFLLVADPSSNQGLGIVSEFFNWPALLFFS